MAFADYDIFATTTTVALDTITVIAGVSSLRVTPSASGGLASIIAKVGSAYDIGALTVGRQRALFLPLVVTASSPTRFGFTAMQSQRDIRTTGTCYHAHIAGNQANSIQLYRNSAGLTPGTLLGSAAYTIADGTPVALEFQWIYNATELLGTDLTVKAGTSFATMTTRIHVIDLVSAGAPTVSVGQGIALQEQNGTFQSDWRLDTHEIFGPP